jgi:hypothetical protein
LGIRPSSSRRPISRVNTLQGNRYAHQVFDDMPGQPAVTRRVRAPVSAPSAGGVPSPRWGASGRVASASHSWTAGQARHQPAGEGPMARREARGAGIRRRHGSVDRPVARRARSMRWGALDPGLRPPRPAARNAPRHEGRPPSPPCGARRGVEGWRVVRSHSVVVAAAR